MFGEGSAIRAVVALDEASMFVYTPLLHTQFDEALAQGAVDRVAEELFGAG